MTADVIRLTDPLHVKRYLSHPQIWEAISSGVAFEDFIPPMGPNDHYLVTGPEAMFYLHPFTAADNWEIHAHVHPDYRRNASESTAKTLRYAFTELSALKVVCLIPEVFPRVRGFALKCGLVDQGFITDSYRRDNTVYGQWLLGISRQEFEEQDNGFC